jgi:hypothetical protein
MLTRHMSSKAETVVRTSHQIWYSVATVNAKSHHVVCRWEGKKIPTTATWAAQKYLAALPRYGHRCCASSVWRKFCRNRHHNGLTKLFG